MLVTSLAAIAVALATAAQEFACYETYVGVIKLKIAVEADKNWFAQWLVGNKWRLLLIKPALVAAGGAALICVGPQLNFLPTFLAFALSGVAIFLGVSDGYGDYQVNQETLAAQKK
jgi:hypothetical protein